MSSARALRGLSLLVIAAVLLCAAACSTPPVQHPAHGVIKAIAPDRLGATIQHDRVPTLDMEPMTMDFRMRDGNVLNGIAVGDTVDFIIETGAAAGAVVIRVQSKR